MATFLSKIECPDCDTFMTLTEADETEPYHKTFLTCSNTDCEKVVEFLPAYCKWPVFELLDADESMILA